MKKPWKLIGLLAICAVLLMPLGALADSISPATMSFTGKLGALSAFTFHKTVTVSAGVPTTVKTDIMFLSDTTGSMGGTISTVKTNAGALLTATSSLGDVQWAVGDYKDFPISPYGNVGDYPFKLDQAMTANTALVQAGINTWSAAGGNDTPEANLTAIQQSTLPATGWRAGAARILVQFGDAYGHDPDLDAGYPGVNLATATTALTSTGTKLIAVDVGDKNGRNQETAMVAAAGGSYLDNPSQATLIDAVVNAIETSFKTYKEVKLAISGLPPGVDLFFSTTPAAYTDDFSRETERKFEFDVTLVGCCAEIGFGKSFDFTIDALVDGAIVASELDHWTCPIPVPPSMLLLGSGLLGLISLRRFRRN